jgi:CheY-like chemotaxis protein
MKERILIADSNKETREALKQELTALGYDVREATSSSKALWLMSMEMFDLVMTDTEMPDISGIELCRRIKNNPDKAVPVVFYSNTDDDCRILSAVEAGADHFVSKTTHPVLLDKIIRKALTEAFAEA